MPDHRGDRHVTDRTALALSLLAGGRRSAARLLADVRAPDLRAELLSRACGDVDAAVAAVGPRSAAGWLVKQLDPAPASGLAGALAGPATRRDVITELRRQGHGQRAIAARLGVSIATVGAVLAATDPAQLPAWTVAANGRRYPARRGDATPTVPVGPGEAGRRAAARELYERGASVRAVARALGVGRAVATRLISESYRIDP